MKKVVKARKNGVIIPTALFVAQVVLLLVTFMFASITYNFNMSLGQVEATEFRYLSLGAANELISKLNNEIELNDGVESPPIKDGELQYDAPTKEDPEQFIEQGRVIERWIEPLDDEVGEKVLVVARTYRQSRSNAQEVRLLARFRSNTLARVYNNSLDGDRSTVDPIYYSESSPSGAWEQLPDVTKVIYGTDGALQTFEGETANSIPYISGSPDGSVYVLYAPVLDGWEDRKATMALPPIHGLNLAKLGPLIEFTLTGGLSDVGVVLESVLGLLSPQPTLDIKLGKFALNTIDTGNKMGMTIGDLQPINQVLIEYASEVTIAKGASMLKYDHDSDSWKTLPPLENLVLADDGQFVSETGNYYVQGVAGPPTGFEGGMAFPLYRKGQDAVIRYDDKEGTAEKVNLSTLPVLPAQGETGTPPVPGKDILLLASDQTGAVYAQTGDLEPVDFNYLLDVMLGNLDSISAETLTSSIHKYENGTLTHVPNPPAKFFDKSGNLVEDPYPGSRGPTLGGMVGGETGELTVVNRPTAPGLVDTVYRFRDNEWEVVPSPPNTYYDSTGNEVDDSGLPDRLEIGMGAEGNLILRIPTTKGSDSVFVESENEGEYDILPPVTASDGGYVKFLSQMSAGKKRDGSKKGEFRVYATYLD